MIFGGFVILRSAIIESGLEGLAPGASFAFLGPLYPPLVFLQDLIGSLVVLAVVASILRRLIAPPKRLQVEGHAKWDAILILGLILTVMVTMFGQNATRTILHPSFADGARFISSPLAELFAGMDAGSVAVWYGLFFLSLIHISEPPRPY